MSLIRNLFFRGGSDKADCGHVTEHGSDLIDGDCDETLARRLRAHLRECEDCDTWIGTLRATVSLLKGLPKKPTPERTVTRVREFTSGKQ